MRTWVLAGGEQRCGSCGEMVRRDQPLLVIDFPELTRKLYRCAACAGEPVQLAGGPAKVNRVEQSTASAMQRLTGAFQPGLGLDEERR